MIDWTSLNFASIVPAKAKNGWAIEGIYDVSDPGYAVKHSFRAASVVGSISPLIAPGSNTAWSLDFLGPEMRCSNVSSSFEDRIVANALDHMTTFETCGTVWGYLGWQGDGEEPLPFLDSDIHNIRGPANVTDEIYLAVFPKLMEAIKQEWSTIYNSNCTARETYQNAMTERTIMRCTTYNVSYHLDIAFTDGIQQINTSVIETHDRVGFIANIFDPDPFSIPGTDQYNLTLVQTIAYQSVVWVFHDMLLGSLASYGGINLTIYENRTSIRDTVLRGCKELAPIQRHEAPNTDLWFQGKYNSISNSAPSREDFPLARQLEELFRKVTISLMTQPTLQPNISSPYPPLPTTVAFTTAENIFVYSPSTLWLAYGLALSTSLLCVLQGLFAVLSSKSSFTTQFSTILRASRGAGLDTDIQDQDYGGQDPLPKYLEEMEVTFRGAVEPQADDTRTVGLTTRTSKGEPQGDLVRMSTLQRPRSDDED